MNWSSAPSALPALSSVFFRPRLDHRAHCLGRSCGPVRRGCSPKSRQRMPGDPLRRRMDGAPVYLAQVALAPAPRTQPHRQPGTPRRARLHHPRGKSRVGNPAGGSVCLERLGGAPPWPGPPVECIARANPRIPPVSLPPRGAGGPATPPLPRWWQLPAAVRACRSISRRELGGTALIRRTTTTTPQLRRVPTRARRQIARTSRASVPCRRGAARAGNRFRRRRCSRQRQDSSWTIVLGRARIAHAA